jgi:methylated-DNA-protein-cysteine methyltransferase-like protein
MRTESRKKGKQNASALYQKIWETVRRIPFGRVATYGQIAALAGHPRQPRLIGYAMHRTPEDSGVPWHRVVNAKGEISRRAASILSGEENLQRVLLEREGVEFDSAGRIDLKRFRWMPRRRSSRKPRG